MIIMGRCCRCMSVGLCKNCSCVRAGTPCVDCYPSRTNRCCNRGVVRSSSSDSHRDSSSSEEETNIQDGGNTRGDHYVSVPHLPLFVAVSDTQLTTDFSEAIDIAYSKIVCWRANVFRLPVGAVARKFLAELTRLFNAFNERSSLEKCAIKAAMVLPGLVLQRPHSKSKEKDHRRVLERRLNQWKDGDVSGLVNEGEIIQKHLPRIRSHKGVSSKSFSTLMQQGKVKSAIRALSANDHNGVLQLHQLGADGKSVLDTLIEKHPLSQHPSTDTLLSQADTDTSNYSHPIIFDSITAEAIRRAAIRTGGSAGPSGVDSWSWRRFCSTYGRESSDLCDALAVFCRRLCTSYVDPSSISAYTACRLIPLDKNPGVRPIGVAEVCRRILGKVIMTTCKNDLITAVCPYQLCAGLDAGCESAFHAMKQVYDNPNIQAVLMVDASNAFNNLNRFTTLHNLPLVCPALAPVLINTYREPSDLFVAEKRILSQEGTTQGDPLAMAMYAIGTLPLIKHLRHDTITQIWYADDSAAGGNLQDLKRWWSVLNEWGPKYGYFPNDRKTTLLVKKEFLNEANEIFDGTGLHITSDGVSYLGAPIGTNEYVERVVEKKVMEWSEEITNLANIGTKHPHEAYASFIHGFTSKWNYFFRVIDLSATNINNKLNALETSISTHFIPTITAMDPPGTIVRDLLSLPINKGGIGIIDPRVVSVEQHTASKLICSPLVDLILFSSIVTNFQEIIDCIYRQKEIKNRVIREKRNRTVEKVTSFREIMDPSLQRRMDLACEKGASVWLSTLPIKARGFALHKTAFRDALCLRYGWSFKDSPSHCACGADSTLDHLLSCPNGGFPTIRHNELRDITANMLTEVCSNVSIEPRIQPLTGESMEYASSNTAPEARLDVAASGVWGSRFERSYFDVRVFNPYAPSNRIQSLPATYKRHQDDKNRQYLQRVREVEQASFTPLIFSTTGGMGQGSQSLYKRIASLISDKTSTPYSIVINLIRCKLNFALLRSSIMCIRGTRSAFNKPLLDIPLDLQYSESRLSV